MTTRLKDQSVKAFPIPQTGNRIHYDADVQGFGVRVTAGGSRSFVLNYFLNGRERRITIGAYPVWSVTAARDEAGKLRRRVDAGEDPLAEKEKAFKDPTVQQVAGQFLTEHVALKNRTSTQALYRRSIEGYVLPRIGARKVNAVTFQDVARVHVEVTRAHGLYAANRTAAVLSKMFNMSIRWGYRTDNPAKGIERNQEVKRERFLKPDELVRLADTLRRYPDLAFEGVDLGRATERARAEIGRRRAMRLQSANVIRFALLTGARIGEVLSADWTQVDLESGVWVKPAANTKQKKLHRVPISKAALELLLDIRAAQADSERFVFPGLIAGQAQTEVKNAWRSIRELAGLTDVRLHDLRHSYAAVLASAGLSLPVIGAMLGHTQAATTLRYAHLLDDPLRRATEIVGANFKTASGAPKAEVVLIRGRV